MDNIENGRIPKVVDTKEAAKILGMAPITLRTWASRDSGPIKPIRVGKNRLRWREDDLIELLGGSPKN